VVALGGHARLRPGGGRFGLAAPPEMNQVTFRLRSELPARLKARPATLNHSKAALSMRCDAETHEDGLARPAQVNQTGARPSSGAAAFTYNSARESSSLLGRFTLLRPRTGAFQARLQRPP